MKRLPFDGCVTDVGEDDITVSCPDLPIPVMALKGEGIEVGQTVCVALRPEKIFLSIDKPEDDDAMSIPAVVEDLGYLGNRSLYRIRLGNGRVIQVSRQNQRRSATRFVEWEDDVWVSWRPRSTIVIPGED